MSAGGMDMLAEAKVNYLTLPGEAAISARGLSYYVLNYKSTRDACVKYLFGDQSAFDVENKFLNSKEISFVNIYNDTNYNYRVYNNDTLDKIHIPKKQKS